jgi:uncharacterized damage-inducible protein DinB
MKSGQSHGATLARFAGGPDALEQVLAGLTEADLDALPADGGWTIRQIVHHLVDGDDLWKLGIKAALGHEQAEFSFEWYGAQPQDTWAERWAYADRRVDVSLALLRAIRAHVIQLLTHVPAPWDRALTVRTRPDETARLTVAEIVAMQADHLEHHLQRIRAIGKEQAETR